MQPKRTIRVAIWSGEEEGLLGSAKYVERYLKGDDKKAEREKMSVYLNIDPGTGPIYGFYMENNDAAKAIFDAWLEPFRDLGMRRNVLPGIGATDHLSFTRVGIPGFNVVQEYADYDVRMHHTNVDTFERVREADLQQNAIVLASFLYHAAMRKEKIPIGKPATSSAASPSDLLRTRISGTVIRVPPMLFPSFASPRSKSLSPALLRQ